MIKTVAKPWLVLGLLGLVVLTVLVLINGQRQSAPSDFQGEKSAPQVKSFYGPATDYVSPVARNPQPRSGGYLSQAAPLSQTSTDFPPVQAQATAVTPQADQSLEKTEEFYKQKRMTVPAPVSLPPALQAKLGDVPEAQYQISEPIISPVTSGKIRQLMANNQDLWQPVRKPLESNFGK